MENKERKFEFFEETFLLADISIDITLDIPLFTLSNIEIDFVDCHIYWIMYTIAEVLPTMR